MLWICGTVIQQIITKTTEGFEIQVEAERAEAVQAGERNAQGGLSNAS